ncbi:MAG: ribosome-associated translation inhibitor RaiA, partial [Chitinophagaceae bacterium]|nr:ribosome-associated translation inhibitor RaiA [Chitinophagaceae bacterium]
EEKAGKLYQFYDKIINIEATLNVENSDTKENKACGIRLIIPGNDLWASAQCKTFEEAAVQAVEALEKQLDKKKTKMLNKRTASKLPE